MINKKQIVFTIVSILVLSTAGFIFLKIMADKSKEKSDEILKEFKKVDESLRQTNKTFDSLQRVKVDSVNSSKQ